jgi:hypothetical protein
VVPDPETGTPRIRHEKDVVRLSPAS